MTLRRRYLDGRPIADLLGCTHPSDEPHRPYCPVVLDAAEPDPDPAPTTVDPLGAPDTYHPDDHQPMAGDPYWQETP